MARELDPRDVLSDLFEDFTEAHDFPFALSPSWRTIASVTRHRSVTLHHTISI